MDNILEKILKRAYKRSDEILSVDDPDYKRAFVRHYSLGASEQRAIDIEKACEWLEKYMERLGYIDEWCRQGEDDFRKAMEE